MSGLNKLMMDSSKSRIVCSLQAEEGKEEWKEGERERGGGRRRAQGGDGIEGEGAKTTQNNRNSAHNHPHGRWQ